MFFNYLLINELVTNNIMVIIIVIFMY